MQIFGNKYGVNSDPLADDAAEGEGKEPHRLTVVHLVKCYETALSYQDDAKK